MPFGQNTVSDSSQRSYESRVGTRPFDTCTLVVQTAGPLPRPDRMLALLRSILSVSILTWVSERGRVTARTYILTGIFTPILGKDLRLAESDHVANHLNPRQAEAKHHGVSSPHVTPDLD